MLSRNMGSVRRHFVMALAAIASAARAETPLENKGKPMLAPFECTLEDSEGAGLSCSDEQPCPVFLELSAVTAVGNRIFVTGNIHTADATLYSILLTSADAGQTWSEATPRIRFSGLDQIQFIDFETGWISGANLFNAPRDPFFLITTDGGKTWRERRVYEDGRAGVIEKFRFDSRAGGAMLVVARYENRHELYETATGGESWSLVRESRDPIAFPKALSEENAAWRVRADGASRAYDIERSQGEHWAKVASFLVNIGQCKQ
jgi:hypothetical protein